MFLRSASHDNPPRYWGSTHEIHALCHDFLDAPMATNLDSSQTNNDFIETKNINIKCTVCQDEFNEQDDVRLLPCEHIYHLDCIDAWLKEHSYKCPCCRKPAAEHAPKI
jgi:hypothetical protein